MAGYVKLFDAVLDSTVWEATPPTKVVWITMLVMADRDGYVGASVPGLAKRAGVERAECERALALFLAPDPDSRTKEHDGRRIEESDGGWRVLNYEKYRDRASAEEKRVKDAARQRRKYERDKAGQQAMNPPPSGEGTGPNLTPEPPNLTREAHAPHGSSPNLASHLISDPSAEADAEGDPDPDQTREAAPPPPDPHPQEPEPDDRQPYAGLQAREVAEAWCHASAGQVFASGRQAREAQAAFAAMAQTFERAAGDDARVACWAYCRWLFQAPDGPVRTRKMEHPRPWSVQPGVSEDMGRVYEWFESLPADERESIVPRRSNGRSARELHA